MYIESDGGVARVGTGTDPSGAEAPVEPAATSRTALIAVSRRTGQQVKRAAAGAEGPVLDHYSADALDAHLAAVAGPLVDAAGAENIDAVFCDSFEVYESDWTRGLVAEFVRRRGYDPTDRLWLLRRDEAGTDDPRAQDPRAGPRAQGLRADHLLTLTELLEENFVARLARWSEQRGVRLRIQAYGEPPASVSTYRHAHEFEGEGLGWDHVTATRWASSAARRYRHRIVSSETWTWTHSPSFRATPLDLAAEAQQHLLSGVNQFVGHGWPYSPPEAVGLGWFFYAAGCLDDRNPWWPAAPSLMSYLARLAGVMRHGTAVRNVALYVRAADAAQSRASDVGHIDLFSRARDRIGGAVPQTIVRAGHDFDLLDDEALRDLPPDSYPVVVLAGAASIPPRTGQWLDEAREAGTIVVEVHGGAGDRTGDADAVSAALRGVDAPLGRPAPGVGVAVRDDGDVRVHFVANTTAEHAEWVARPQASDGRMEQWIPDTGSFETIGDAGDGIRLSLAPYEALVLVRHSGAPHGAATAPPAPTRTNCTANAGTVNVAEPARTGTIIELEDWTVRFPARAAEAVTLPHRWEDSATTAAFSGTAVYEASVTLPSAPSWALLDLGEGTVIEGDLPAAGPAYRARLAPPVGEIAAIRINGARAGMLWHPPYRLELAPLLRAGRNTVGIAVSNTAANALALDPFVAPLASAMTAVWGERFLFQDLHQATADVSSGLLRVPRLLLTGEAPPP